MYYLEDKHPTEEYTVYIQVKCGTPYIGVWSGTSMLDVYKFIKEIEKKHARYNQHFFIDNDFYNNHYSKGDYSYYYRFMVRKVNDWKTLKTKETNLKVA
jgi:hypothetical protein